MTETNRLAVAASPSSVIRVNMTLDAPTLAFMDRESARMKDRLGVTVGRSEMIRAVFGAISDTGIGFGSCRSEDDIRNALRRHFQRIAESLHRERASRAAAQGGSR